MARSAINTYGFALGIIIGGGGFGFLGYGAGLLRGKRKAVDDLNKRIKDINEEKIRETERIRVSAALK
jgi:hypothetical protein